MRPYFRIAPVGATLDPIKPSFEIGEPDNDIKIVGVDIPEPKRTREDEKPKKRSYIIEDQDIAANDQLNLQKRIFIDSEANPLGGNDALKKYLSPLADYLLAHPSVTIKVIIHTPVPEGGRFKRTNGKVEPVVRDRLSAIREPNSRSVAPSDEYKGRKME